MASLLLPKSMSMPTIDASDEMLDVRLLPDDVSGASITEALYSFGVPKATAMPKMAANPTNTLIHSLSCLMARSRPTMSSCIFCFMSFPMGSVVLCGFASYFTMLMMVAMMAAKEPTAVAMLRRSCSEVCVMGFDGTTISQPGMGFALWLTFATLPFM